MRRLDDKIDHLTKDVQTTEGKLEELRNSMAAEKESAIEELKIKHREGLCSVESSHAIEMSQTEREYEAKITECRERTTRVVVGSFKPFFNS